MDIPEYYIEDVDGAWSSEDDTTPEQPDFDSGSNYFNKPAITTDKKEKSVTTPLDVHIRIYKRNGKKYVTTVEGLDLEEVIIKKFISKCSKKYSCGGSYDKKDKIVKFSGDFRNNISEFLLENEIVEKQNLHIHGF
uniref:SUI1 domain-containing protein n=1 Tax=viral metagenome TaxID=1070528 RepID=A0A6C0JS28_9ZZZZ